MSVKRYFHVGFWFFILAVLFFYTILFWNEATAQSSLGIGVAEPVATPSASFFGQFFLHVQIWQKKFERLISSWLISLQTSPWQAVKLLSVSFLYGILHASGPGHGKAVISSYLVANRETVKRGIILSFWSSLLQAFSAIALVVAIYWYFSARLTEATHYMVKISFLCIMLLGLWLLWCKTKPLILFLLFSLKNKQNKKFQSLFNNHENIAKTTHKAKNEQSQHDFVGFAKKCLICGNSHIFSAEVLQSQTDWKQAIIAVFSVGLRPCTGAIFVMSFCILNNLFWVGVMAVLFMALGTFITVAILAAFALKAKNVLENWQNLFFKKWVLPIIEWLMALFIFLFGLMLFFNV